MLNSIFNHEFPHINLMIKCIAYFSVCRDVQKQKALVKNESLLTILSGEMLQRVLVYNSSLKRGISVSH